MLYTLRVADGFLDLLSIAAAVEAVCGLQGLAVAAEAKVIATDSVLDFLSM